MLVTDSADPSGIGVHMLTLATALRAHAEVLIVFARESAALRWWQRAVSANLRAQTLATADIRAGGRGLVELLRIFRADMVHIHAGISWEGHGAARAARIARLPAVVRTEHLPYTLRPLKNPALEAWYARQSLLADRIICVSDAGRATFRMASVDISKYRTVHNGVCPAPPPARSRDTVREELRVENSPLILTVARLSEQKRHHVLLHAMPRVLASCPAAQLLLVGSGPLEASLKNLAATLGIAGRVHFLGVRSDVPDLLAASDVFCLPSHFEGHPLALMEAMASGLPVVATRAAGITEVIVNGETGILVPVDNPLALSAALVRMLINAVPAQAMGQRGRSAILEQFTVERMAERTVAVYRELLPDRLAIGSLSR